MGRYIVKRILYSVWILLGIMVVTFVLFRVSAGDPTAVLLGKNPTAADVEAMRDSMGCDKPLFFGRWRVTELYPAADFTGGRTEIPGIELNGIEPEKAAEQDGLHLGTGSAVFGLFAAADRAASGRADRPCAFAAGPRVNSRQGRQRGQRRTNGD